MPVAMLLRPSFRFSICFLAVMGVMSVTMMRLCDLQFRCGCTALASAHCNIHHLARPHCPWCEHPVTTAAGILVLMLPTVAGATALAVQTRVTGYLLPMLAGLAGYV